MITEIKKSVSAVLYERLSSPFYGAFLASWLVWNWKIIYLSIFVSEAKIEPNKLDYILKNYSDSNILIIYPLISTALLITLFPFITNGAFFLHIKFNKWKLDQKNSLEMKTLLTLEQSIQLREELLKAEERMEGLLERKNQEIKELTIKITELNDLKSHSKIESAEKGQNEEQSDDDVNQLANKINSSSELKKSFDVTVKYIQAGYSNLLKADGVTSKAIAYFESHNLIESAGQGMYVFTDLGKEVLRKSLESSFVTS